MLVDEFVVGFHDQMDRISKHDMNDELKGHLFLMQENLYSRKKKRFLVQQAVIILFKPLQQVYVAHLERNASPPCQ